MSRPRTGWQEYTEVITARFNTLDPHQAKAIEIIKRYQSYGRSVQSILTTALLASEDMQFTEPTLGDVAASQIMVSVRELGEILNELKQYRAGSSFQPVSMPDDAADDDYADQVLAFMSKRIEGQ